MSTLWHSGAKNTVQLLTTAGSDIGERVGKRFLPSSQSQTAGVSTDPAAQAVTMASFYESWLHFTSNPEQEITHNSDITGFKLSFLHVWVCALYRILEPAVSSVSNMHWPLRLNWHLQGVDGEVESRKWEPPMVPVNHWWGGSDLTAQVHRKIFYNVSSMSSDSSFVLAKNKPENIATFGMFT